MKALIVRAVDSGNIQRSPTFQAIFSYYFSDFDQWPFQVIFDSGGIDVDKILANSTPATKKLDIINAGMSYDVIRGDNKRLAEELSGKLSGKSESQIPDHEKERITRLYSEVKTDVHLLQMGFRNEALLDAGIPARYLPGMRVPFRHESDLGLILPLDKSVAMKIDDYYKTIEVKKPTTRIYGDLAGTDPLIDELTGGADTARKQVRYYMETRDRAMSAILKLLSDDAR